MDPDPGDPKTYGSDGTGFRSGFASATLHTSMQNYLFFFLKIREEKYRGPLGG
jgi:hypothetical protein